MKVNEHKVHLCKIYYYLVVRDIEKNTFSFSLQVFGLKLFQNISHMFYVLLTVT